MQDLQNKANEIRQDIIKMLLEAGSGHSAGPLGMADVFTALYFGEVMSYDPKNPKWEKRDRLILSNGHICPVLYATLAHADFFPHEELMTLRKLGTRLQGHPETKRLPGVETTSGPLGSGLAQASGYAYASRMDNKRFRVYCICSDGEHDEGNHWEAVAFAGKYNLSNLTVFVDRNGIQIDGYTEDVMPLEPLRAKYEAFNWSVLEVDGHNIEEKATKEGWGEGLVAVGEANEGVIVISADTAGSVRNSLFKDKFPERFVQVGVAEQAMATIAAGMANYGKIPFIATYAMFSPGRNWGQIW